MPAPPGLAIVPAVKMVATVAGTLETFDYIGYAQKLATLVGVASNNIKVTAKVAGTRLRRSLQQGSLEVTSEIRTQNAQLASAVEAIIKIQTPETLSTALGATVTSFSAEVTSAVVNTSSPSPPPPSASPVALDDDTTSAQTASGTDGLGGGAIAGIVIVAVLLLAAIVFIAIMITREKSGSPIFTSLGDKVPAVTSVQVSTTSATAGEMESALAAHDKI